MLVFRTYPMFQDLPHGSHFRRNQVSWRAGIGWLFNFQQKVTKIRIKCRMVSSKAKLWFHRKHHSLREFPRSFWNCHKLIDKGAWWYTTALMREYSLMPVSLLSTSIGCFWTCNIALTLISALTVSSIPQASLNQGHIGGMSSCC